MFEDQTFENIMERMLEQVDSEIDKREGSIIYDALAPAAVELRSLYLSLDRVLSEFFIHTATPGYLNMHGENFGLEPYAATYAAVIGEVEPAGVDIAGCVFSIGTLNYVAYEPLDDPDNPGRWLLNCQTAGEAGNLPEGQLLPVTEVPGLASIRIVGVAAPGDEAEDTEVFRQRLLDAVKNPAFGGNVADYTQKVMSLTGVGLVRISPCTNEKREEAGGHVMVEILDEAFEPAGEELIEMVSRELNGDIETVIDGEPTNVNGLGYGTAPIGHKVHVTAPELKPIEITATVTTVTGMLPENIGAALGAALMPYFEELRTQWSRNISKRSLTVSVVKILYELLELEDIDTVQSLSINGDEVLTTGQVLTAEYDVGGWALPVPGNISITQ